MSAMSESEGMEAVARKLRPKGGRPSKDGEPRRRTSLSLPVPLVQMCFNKADELGISVSDLVTMYISMASGLTVPDHIIAALKSQANAETQDPLLEAS